MHIIINQPVTVTIIAELWFEEDLYDNVEAVRDAIQDYQNSEESSKRCREPNIVLVGHTWPEGKDVEASQDSLDFFHLNFL